MAYPLPTNNETKDLTSFFGYANNLAEGLFMAGLLGVIWVVILISMKNSGNAQSWTTASLICASLSIPFAVLGWIAPWVMYLFFVLTAIGFIWLKLQNS